MNTHDPQTAETKSNQSPYLAPYNEGLSTQIEEVLPTLNDVDRPLVEEAHRFLLTGDQSDFSQVKLHGDNVGAVIAYGVSDPRMDRMLGKLMAVLCEHHIAAAETGLNAEVQDPAAIKHSLVLALDAAKSLAHPKGYEDPTLLLKVKTLIGKLPIDDLEVVSLNGATSDAIRKITETR